jgi:hypothetical protein
MLLQALDDALRIGVPPAAITELVGPATVGKSQFCYTLALQVRHCWSTGGIYLCSSHSSNPVSCVCRLGITCMPGFAAKEQTASLSVCMHR